jgi:hypothetical protein
MQCVGGGFRCMMSLTVRAPSVQTELPELPGCHCNGRTAALRPARLRSCTQQRQVRRSFVALAAGVFVPNH